MFASVSDFTSRIGNLSNGRAYTCYCKNDFTNLITSGGSSGTARGFFSKNINETTDFLVIVMGDSNIMYSARLNNTGEGVTYNKTFSDDATLPLPLKNNMRKIHTGWIRVAKYQGKSASDAQGGKGYGALLTIKSFYSSKYPVYYIISFHAGYQISGFTILDSYKGNGILQNIRHTVDANTDTAYIELNISDSASEDNPITVTILDNIDGYGDNKWEPVNAESTDESVSGVTVISSLSLK